MAGFRFKISGEKTITATKKVPRTIGIASGDDLFYRSPRSKKETKVEGTHTFDGKTVFRSDGVTYVTITTPKENL